jgi:stage II sporulation protein D
VATACAAPESSVVAPPEAAPAGGPVVAVGVATSAPRVTVGGGDALRLRSAEGRPLGAIAAGRTASASATGSGITLISDDGRDPAPTTVIVTPIGGDGLVRVDGRDYRGTVELRRDGRGLTVVDRVGLESYLAGVVSAELGVFPEGDDQAVMAQAVVSRTYAMRNLGRWRAQGFDLAADVGDQRYDGAGGETPQAWRAVRATTGQILTWQGRPIDAFFHSTCGGRTADATEVFSGGSRPYLRSVADVDRDGLPYCRISPRYQWREAWSGSELVAALRRSLPAESGVPAAAIREVRSIGVASRSSSGRVASLQIDLGGRTVTVTGAAVRRVLIPPGQDLLRSAAFTLSAERRSGQVTALVAEGHGSGHGVGLCQWGAIGRARAGQRYPEILRAYFPGTVLTRQY